MSVTIPGTAPGTMAEAGLGKGPFRAPRGAEISCKGWQQEAAALQPRSGGSGEAGRLGDVRGGRARVRGLDAGSKVGGEGLVMLEILGIDDLGFTFGGAGQEQ